MPREPDLLIVGADVALEHCGIVMLSNALASAVCVKSQSRPRKWTSYRARPRGGIAAFDAERGLGFYQRCRDHLRTVKPAQMAGIVFEAHGRGIGKIAYACSKVAIACFAIAVHEVRFGVELPVELYEPEWGKKATCGRRDALKVEVEDVVRHHLPELSPPIDALPVWAREHCFDAAAVIIAAAKGGAVRRMHPKMRARLEAASLPW